MLHCAGQIGDVLFGPSFTATNTPPSIDQVLISPTANSANGNSICIHSGPVGVWCMGNLNDSGQLGNGSISGSPAFMQWMAPAPISRLATGTWDQICALDLMGEVWCSGLNFGPIPMPQGPGGHQTLWVATSGAPMADDPTVLRAEAGRSECQVKQMLGLDCGFALFGMPGAVVDGTHMQLPPPTLARECWLTSTGSVQCTDATRFGHGTVLALAAAPYTTDLCVVYADGSLWCLGSNSFGELGTGDSLPVSAERQVQPPGSVALGCQ
jgi:hypothetical protein